MNILIQHALKYKEYYQQPIQPIFHTICSCITAQQISFYQGRELRKKLYHLCGYPLTQQRILQTDLSTILPNKLINIFNELAIIDDTRNIEDVLNDYKKIKGIGEWTISAVSILMNYGEINLASDAYIRKNISIYNNKKMTKKECFNFIEEAKDYKSDVCYFLWRIKSESIHNEILTKEDFI